MNPEAKKDLQNLDTWDCFIVLCFVVRLIYVRKYKPAPLTLFIMHVCVAIVIVAAIIPHNLLFIPIVLGVSISYGIIVETIKRIEL